MRALSIRQPYAELILRGIKPIEFRSRPTKRIGERFYIYASRQWAEVEEVTSIESTVDVTFLSCAFGL
jgi:predicted transcriptional regulator